MCVSSASTDLCGGQRVNRCPYRDRHGVGGLGLLNLQVPFCGLPGYRVLGLGAQTTKDDRLDSAGINRHGVANERVVQGRNSEPPWPRAM